MFLPKRAFSYISCYTNISYRKMHFAAETCLFPAEKEHIPVEKFACLFRGAHGRKPQEIAGGFQGLRIKNASQLSEKI